MLLHLFDTNGQKWQHFTALWDCTVVLPPANSGGGKATTRTSFRVNFNEDYSGSLRFDNAITGTLTSVALPVHRLFHIFKNEGERREQHGKHTQKDTGHWKRAVNCLNLCLFQKSFQMTEYMCCFLNLWEYSIYEAKWTNERKIHQICSRYLHVASLLFVKYVI